MIIVEQSGKSVKIFIGLEKTCLGVLDRGECENNNAEGLKEVRGIEMSTTVLSIYAMHRSLRFEYLLLRLLKQTPQNFLIILHGCLVEWIN